MKNYFRLLSFVKIFWGWALLSVILGTAAVASGIGLLGTSAFIIAKASLQPAFSTLQIAIVGVRFFGISRGVFRYLERLATHNLNLKILPELRVWFYQKIEPLFPAKFSKVRLGDLFTNLTTDIESLEDFYVRVVAPPVTAILITIGVSIFAGFIHPFFALILCLGLVISSILILILVGSLTRKSNMFVVRYRGEFSDILKDMVSGSFEHQIYGVQPERLNHFNRIRNEYYFQECRIAWQKNLSTFLITLFPGLILWSMLWVGIPLVTEGRITVISLAVISLIAYSSFEAINPLAQVAEEYEGINEAAGRVFNIKKIEPEVQEPIQPERPLFRGGIKISNLCFRYAQDMPMVLDNVSLQLIPGKKLAIIGPTGAGKTTLINVLMRFWEFESGEIELDGKNIRKISFDDIHRYFSISSQFSYVFGGTILDNLLLADPGASIARINHILEITQLLDWISDLPEGINTSIGENAVLMSAGQRQRLILARMLLKNSPVLIFDEPTANLDVITAEKFWRILKGSVENASVLWITHRLMNMSEMDEILYMDKGKLLERGTHANLMQLQGFYHKFWNIQNKDIFELRD